MSLRMLWDSIYGLCQVSVHREGVNPSSMEGVLDLSDHISVSRKEQGNCFRRVGRGVSYSSWPMSSWHLLFILFSIEFQTYLQTDRHTYRATTRGAIGPKKICRLYDSILSIQILTIRLNYKLQWREGRMAINESADWNGGEINISPDNIDVRAAVIMIIEFSD